MLLVSGEKAHHLSLPTLDYVSISFGEEDTHKTLSHPPLIAANNEVATTNNIHDDDYKLNNWSGEFFETVIPYWPQLYGRPSPINCLSAGQGRERGVWSGCSR